MISVQDLFLKVIKQDENAHGTTYNSATVDIFNLAGVAAKCLFVVAVGTNTDNFTALKLQGSNADNGSDWEDVDGSVVGTDLDVNGNVSTLPDTTFTNKNIAWTVNTNSGAYRYYRLVATADSAGTSCHFAFFVLLGQRGNVALTQDIATGVTELLCVPPVIPTTH